MRYLLLTKLVDNSLFALSIYFDIGFCVEIVKSHRVIAITVFGMQRWDKPKPIAR